uniref:Ig-like domain-containing protein n=1 Tax=Macrostomum lignano TaxID=282301 RepID=A0A1I8FC73_9PLAT
SGRQTPHRQLRQLSSSAASGDGLGRQSGFAASATPEPDFEAANQRPSSSSSSELSERWWLSIADLELGIWWPPPNLQATQIPKCKSLIRVLSRTLNSGAHGMPAQLVQSKRTFPRKSNWNSGWQNSLLKLFFVNVYLARCQKQAQAPRRVSDYWISVSPYNRDSAGQPPRAGLNWIIDRGSALCQRSALGSPYFDKFWNSKTIKSTKPDQPMRTPSTTGLMLCALLALAACRHVRLGRGCPRRGGRQQSGSEGSRGQARLPLPERGDARRPRTVTMTTASWKKGYAYLNSVLRNYRDFDYAYRR